MAHNPIVTRMVEGPGGQLLGFVSYGFYKLAKREWVQEFESAHGRAPNSEEIAAYVATWTPQQLKNATDAASSALSEFAAEAVDEARPGILKEALKGGASRSVLLSMLAALLYTAFLVLVVVALRAAGIDLLSIVNAMGRT